jgi:hypothetical protein
MICHFIRHCLSKDIGIDGTFKTKATAKSQVLYDILIVTNLQYLYHLTRMERCIHAFYKCIYNFTYRICLDMLFSAATNLVSYRYN